MYGTLLGGSYPSFETSFKLYSEYIHKRYAGFVHLKAVFFFLRTLYLAS